MIPNVRRNLRIHLLDEVYMLSKNMFYATYNKGNIRIKYLIEMQVNISLIDMMSSEIMSLNCVKKILCWYIYKESRYLPILSSAR